MPTHNGLSIAKIALAATAGLILSFPGIAGIHSKAKGLIVDQPKEPPEEAQLPGNSCFLQSDDHGSTYLYVEQQQGARLTVFDVTDPAETKVARRFQLPPPGPLISSAYR